MAPAGLLAHLTTRSAPSRCAAAAVLLTVLWLVARTLAPAGGLTRTYFYPLPREADPRALALATGAGTQEEAAAGVDLDFLAERGRPTRDYLVRWRGVWYSPTAERIDLHAGADDGVVVRLDGATLIERSPAAGMHTETVSVELGAGPHELEIRHWQRGGGNRLNLQWAPAGREPAALGSGRLFPADPGVAGYWLRVAAAGLGNAVLLAWVGVPVLLFGRMAWGQASRMTAREAWSRLRTAALPALLVPAQVLLFGPWTVHATNREQFLAPFASVASGGIWGLAPAATTLAALALLLPPRACRRYVALLGAVGVLLWVQGNLLVGDYGRLDGAGLDLSPRPWRASFEAALWIGVVALALSFARTVARAAPTASGLLMALQAAALLLPGLAPDSRPSGAGAGPADAWRLAPPAIYELSGTRNLIHIVLDMFTSHVFADVVRDDRARFDRDWSGFTYYPDHLGALRRTDGSLPAMLTGAAFRNEMPMRRFRAGNATIFEALGRQGYGLRSLTPFPSVGHPDPSRPGAEEAIRYTIPNPYSPYRDYLDAAYAQLLDLSLFRHAPHGLKPRVYRDERWLVQAWRAGGPGAPRAELPISSLAFLAEFTDRLRVGGDAPVYTFLHLVTPHPPLVTEEDCTYAGRPLAHTVESYSAQARCALLAVGALLERLRELDLYDRSGIVVTSDHGWDVFTPAEHPLRGMHSPAGPLDRIATDASPLLLVKAAGAQGPLRTSYAPTAITDVPATLLDLADLPNTLERGTSALALDPQAPRERTYATHDGEATWRRPYYDLLHVFAVNGRVTDPGAWRYERAAFAPTPDRAAQWRAHRVGLRDDDGAPAPSGRSVYRTAAYAAFFVRPDTPRVAFDVRRLTDDPSPQEVTVRVDGRVAGRHRLADDAWRTLEYAVAPRGADDSPFCVELLVSPGRRAADGAHHGVLLRGDFTPP